MDLSESYHWPSFSANTEIVFEDGIETINLRNKAQRRRIILRMPTHPVFPVNLRISNYTLPMGLHQEIGCSHLLLQNILSFEILILDRTITRVLISAARDPTWKWKYAHSLLISDVLVSNHLILRAVYKRKKCTLWKALMSAQIAGMRAFPGQKHANHLSQCMMLSMKYWNIKHVRYAISSGLLNLICELFDVGYQDIGTSDFPQLQNEAAMFSSLLCTMAYFTMKRNWDISGKMEKLMSTFPFPKSAITSQGRALSLCFKRHVKNSCGWAPCAMIRDTEDTSSLKMYRCKGCRLIKYCCRSHQKKHWKFIHSQQCSSVRQSSFR